MDNLPDKTLEGIVAGGSFGFSLSGAGDFNGDGYSDVLAGAPAYNSSTGQMFIFHGGASMDTIAEDILYGEASSNSL